MSRDIWRSHVADLTRFGCKFAALRNSFACLALVGALACAGPAGPPGPAGPGGPGGDAGTPGSSGPVDYGVLTPGELEVAKITAVITNVAATMSQEACVW